MYLLELIQRGSKTVSSGQENVAREEREKVLRLFGKSRCEAEDKQTFYRGYLSAKKNPQKAKKWVGEIHQDRSFVKKQNGLNATSCS